MSLAGLNLDKKAFAYVLAAVVIVSAASYVVFFMPDRSADTTTPSFHVAKHGDPPVAKIKTSGGYAGSGNIDLLVFSGATVEFDGSESYDPDGEVVSYEWSFDDGTVLKGKKVSYTFKLDQPLSSLNTSRLPVFSPLLTVCDNDGKQGFARIFVKVVPSYYKLYLSNSVLSLQKPDEDDEKIRLPVLWRKYVLNYEINETLYLERCYFNLTLHVQKPRLSLLSSIIVSAYDESGNETVLTKTSFTQTMGFWREKVMSLDGEIPEMELKGIKVALCGLSYRGVSLVYGGDDASVLNISLV
ncbi:MAG TPA: PKD domain-containing protein [Thermoplasmatales archaeon]|nr:PKD domain-containing protein [Thermoplasmatales archaeon]